MPYRFYENGKTYLLKRTTEIANSYECEMYAKLDKDFKEYIKNKSTEGLKQSLRSNIAALRGTIAHHRIECHLSEMIGISPPSLKLSITQQEIFRTLRKNKIRYKYFVEEIDQSFNNFIEWLIDYKNKFEPLFLEKKLVIIVRKEDGTIDEQKSVAGTIDCIGKWKTDRGWKTVIFDWKTSKRSLLSHSIQLSGYYWELTNHPFYQEMVDMGILSEAPYFFENGKPQAFCNILGGRRYDFKQYDIDVGKWKKAWEINNNPRALSYNHGTRTVGIKSLCMVCDRVQQCPEFHYTNVGMSDLPEASLE